jgi:hypothetical protein
MKMPGKRLLKQVFSGLSRSDLRLEELQKPAMVVEKDPYGVLRD